MIGGGGGQITGDIKRRRSLIHHKLKGFYVRRTSIVLFVRYAKRLAMSGAIAFGIKKIDNSQRLNVV